MSKRSVLLAIINGGLYIIGTPPEGKKGVAYTYTLQAEGGSGSYAYTCTDPLPPGWGFTDNGDGSATIAGTATGTGHFPISVNLTSPGGYSVVYEYTLSVPKLAVQVLMPNRLIRGVAAAGLLLFASGGRPPYVFASSGEPAGIATVDPASGEFVGTPTTIGSNTVSFSCTDANSDIFASTFEAPVSSGITFTAASPPESSEIGVTYSYQFAAIGVGSLSYALTFSSVPLGGGAALSAAGFLSFPPPSTPIGPIFFQVTATDSITGNTETVSCSFNNFLTLHLSVLNALYVPLGVQTTVPAFLVSASSGVEPFVISIDPATLPAGVTASVQTISANGIVTIVATQPLVAANFTADVVDALGRTSSVVNTITTFDPNQKIAVGDSSGPVVTNPSALKFTGATVNDLGGGFTEVILGGGGSSLANAIAQRYWR